MQPVPFDKIVKNLSKAPDSLLDRDDLLALAAPGAKAPDGKASAAAYKLAYRLKSAGILLPIQRGLWIVAGPRTPRDPAVLAESLYWKMLRKLASATAGRNWMVAGTKALELHLRDVSAPQELRVLTDGASGVFALSPRHKVRFVALRGYGARGGKTLFRRLAESAVRLSAEGVEVPVAGPEHALLEYLTGPARSRDGHLLSRALTRLGPSLRRDTLGSLVALRYVVAVNRLKDAAKRLGFPAAYATCLDVVKREGKGVFLSK